MRKIISIVLLLTTVCCTILETIYIGDHLIQEL